MKRIFKYPVLSGRAIMHGLTPRILSVQEQVGRIMLWAEVDTDAPEMVHKFSIAMTGDEPPKGVYLATLQMGELVCHIYYVGPI